MIRQKESENLGENNKQSEGVDVWHRKAYIDKITKPGENEMVNDGHDSVQSCRESDTTRVAWVWSTAEEVVRNNVTERKEA